MGAAFKVLVVENDSMIGQEVDRALSQGGCTSVTVPDGAQALRMLAAESYDAVFADAAAPGLGGIEIAAQVKAQWPWTPVVVLGDGASEQRAKLAGADIVLRKPVPADALAEAVRRVQQGGAGRVETAPAAKGKRGLGSLILAAMVTGMTAIAYPVVALAGLVWIGAQSAAEERPSAVGQTAVTRIALFFASPFIAMFYMGVMPIVGMLALMKLGAEAETRAGGKPRKGPLGMVGRLIAGGRVWIAEAP